MTKHSFSIRFPVYAMKAISAFVLIVLVALPLYGQTPTPAKPSYEPKPNTKDITQYPKTEQSDAQNLPSSVILRHTDQKQKISSDITSQPDHKTASDWWLVMFTGTLAFAAILQLIVIVLQNRKMSQTLEVMRTELVLTQRPKLRVRNVEIIDAKSDSSVQKPFFAKNEPVEGQLYVSNVGGTRAKITSIGCWVEWRIECLPMKRPYEGKNPNRPISNNQLKPGESLPFKFKSEKLMGQEGSMIREGTHQWRLYVMGYVEYLDDINILRRTAFCRKYRMPEGRFFAVEDSEYEYEE